MTTLRSPAFFHGALLCVATLLMVVACGGGDDGGGTTTPPPAAPAVVAPSALTYTSPANLTVNAAATAMSPTVSGAPTSYAVSPGLPAGLSMSTTTGVISGTPTVLADTATYTVTATNSAGNTTFGLSLKVGAPTATPYSQTNLVSNGSVAGTRTDVKLVNPWGLVALPTGPWWVTNQVSQTSTLYDGTGNTLATVVNIPPGLRGAADPTGIVANGTTEFTVTKSGVTAPARFIFSGQGGTISGWASTVDATNSVIVYDDGAGGARYFGLAMASNNNANTLYAPDFKNGKVDTFDKNFAKITASGGFTDPNLPAGYAPYNIQPVTLGTTTVLVVTYAQRNSSGDEVLGAGLGVVNIFDLNGTLVRRLVSPGGKLNAPWGVVKAPATFGYLANMLLIGNFGDGVINGYDPTSGVWAGSINNNSGSALANAGLWGLQFGNGVQNQMVNTLYFVAGISAETGGLYGRIDLGATAPDAVAPTVSLTAPAAGTVSGTVTLTANATDNVAVTEVRFLVRVGTTTTTVNTDTTAPYSFALNTATLANGAATLSAQAVDAAGNITTSATVAVTVNNVVTPPAPTLATLQTSIFGPVCSSCHSGVGSALPGSMNLTSASATAAALINVDSVEVSSLKRVLPGNATNSYVVHKVEGTQTVGGRMPLGGAALTQTQIDDIKAWIQAGAAP